MASYQATISWELQPGEAFPRYSRDHRWSFDGTNSVTSKITIQPA